uniref:Uncharacterized protein n=1 Tax=Anguilla anguilla TaxID=7936 RepID=A0A0E9WZD8_ANGAN
MCCSLENEDIKPQKASLSLSLSWLSLSLTSPVLANKTQERKKKKMMTYTILNISRFYLYLHLFCGLTLDAAGSSDTETAGRNPCSLSAPPRSSPAKIQGPLKYPHPSHLPFQSI